MQLYRKATEVDTYLHQFGIGRDSRAKVTTKLNNICLEVLYRSFIEVNIGNPLYFNLLNVFDCKDQLGITGKFLYFIIVYGFCF